MSQRNKPPVKRTKIAFPCRVCCKDCTMEQESICCDGCNMWIHQQCIRMSVTQYANFTMNEHFDFFCMHCVNDINGRFNFMASLARIASDAPDLDCMRKQADSERNLLQFYNISLPPVSVPSADGLRVHEASVLLLKRYSPWLLQQFIPVNVGADGNCLFRAISFALYGHEGEYAHLRLLASIEALLFGSLYDVCGPDYYAPYKADEELILPDYNEFVSGLVKDGCYSDMLTVLALSSVVQKPIHTRWPVPKRDGSAAAPTKLVIGRGVQTANEVNVMWSCLAFSEPPVVNHFVPLFRAPVVSYVADAGVADTGVDNAEAANDYADNITSDVELDADEPDAVQWPEQQQLQDHFLSMSSCFEYLYDNAFPVHNVVPSV